MATLRIELKDSVTTVRSEINTSISETATVRNELTIISEIVKKGEHERAEEATARANQKRKREEETYKEKKDKKKKEEERRKRKEDKKGKKLRKRGI